MSSSGSTDKVVASAIEDPFLRRSVKTALHLRRYMPFYIFGTIWIVTLAAFPSIRGGDDDEGFASNQVATTEFGDDSSLGTVTADPALDDAVAAPTGEAGAPVTAGGAAGGGTARTGGGGASRPRGGAAAPGAAAPTGGGGGTAAAQPISSQQAQSAIQRHTGTTRLGTPCGPDQRQIPNSSYAAPCQNVYDGPNGGTTYRGVTDKEIVIVRRKFPESANSRAVDEVNSRAGYASSDVTEEVRKTFIEYFNKSFELYGRKVKYVVYESQNGDSTAEAQSKGKEGACLDADFIAKEIKAFAVMGGSSPFGECAAERKMPVFSAGAYFPEGWYRKYHPYLWHTVMECERISYQVAEYIGKRLLNRPAKWAGDPVMQKKERYFGTYVPDNDGYQRCVQITRNELTKKYGVKDPGPKYDYQLDISRFPDQAAQAAVMFAAEGVTTLILACDFISATVLTAAAERQGWRPEWLSIGVGGTDLDNSARLYDQAQVNGHLFGMSQLGATTKLIGPNSEPGKVYKDATGKTIPEGTSGDYFSLVHMYSLLQAAGPALTPENIGKGAMSLPPGGAPDYPYGFWSFQDGPDGTQGQGDHTTTEDSREVYWVSSKKTTGAVTGKSSDPYYNGPDGKDGTFKEAQGGKRFRNGEWTRDEPPIYPPR